MSHKERDRHIRRIAELFKIPMCRSGCYLYNLPQRTIVYNHMIEYHCNYLYVGGDSQLIILN